MAEESSGRELRIALAMNGGVSLAVWIGGVCNEIRRLCSATLAASVGADADAEPDPQSDPYSLACWIADVAPRADVMAGASAGGLNAVFLALGTVYGHPDLSRMRDLWIRTGGFTSLFRSPLDADVPSLLKGDEYFLPQLAEAVSVFMDPDEHDRDANAEVILTATSMEGEPQSLALGDRQRISERDFAMNFRFRHSADGPRDLTPDPAEGEGDSIGRNRTVARLARACRSTASFPGAFEPSRVRISMVVDASDELEVFPQRQATFSGSHDLIDGGTLVNLPVGEAIQAVFEQSAEVAVRRVLAMVIPDPADIAESGPERARRITLPETISAALSTIPRNQRVFSFLEELESHNDWIDQLRKARSALLNSSAKKLTVLADGLFGAYVSRRADASRSRVERDAKAFLALSAVSPSEYPELLDLLTKAYLPVLPPNVGSTDPRDWGNSTVRRSAARVLFLVYELYEATGQVDPSWQRRIGDAICASGPVAENIFDGVDLSGDTATIEARIKQRRAEYLAPVAECMNHLASVLCEVLTKLNVAGRFVELGPMDHQRATALLLDLEVIESSFGGFRHAIEQKITTVRFDSTVASPLDPLRRSSAKGKVAGAQLGHFAGFLKASWRANDWMWGRMDGSSHLVDLLLSPDEGESASMRQLRVDRMEKAARLLGLEWADEESLMSSVANELKIRIQTTIVLDETPYVVAAIREDESAGGRIGPAAQELAETWASGPGARSERDYARLLLEHNRVGAETIADEQGSDLLVDTATTAVAIGATAMTQAGPKVLKAPLIALRSVSLVAWAITRASRGGSALRTFVAMAFAGATTITVLRFVPGTRLPRSLSFAGICGFVIGALFYMRPYLLGRLQRQRLVTRLLLSVPVGLAIVGALPDQRPSWYSQDWPYPALQNRAGWLIFSALVLSVLVLFAATRLSGPDAP